MRHPFIVFIAVAVVFCVIFIFRDELIAASSQQAFSELFAGVPDTQDRYSGKMFPLHRLIAEKHLEREAPALQTTTTKRSESRPTQQEPKKKRSAANTPTTVPKNTTRKKRPTKKKPTTSKPSSSPKPEKLGFVPRDPPANPTLIYVPSEQPYTVPAIKGTGGDLRRTRTEPPFFFYENQIEMYNTMLAYRLLRHTCAELSDDGEVIRALAVDIGAHEGWYSTYFARLGCRVLAIEPVSAYTVSMQKVLRANDIPEDQIELVDKPVGDKSERNDVVPLDTLITEDAALVKIAVDGSEVAVLRALLRAIKHFEVRDIIVELTPKWWNRVGVSMDDGLRVLEEFMVVGYDLYAVYGQTRSRIESGGNHANGMDFTITNFDKDDMRHVQRVRPEKLHAFVRGIQTQRDVWLHLNTYSLEGTDMTQIKDVVCSNSEEWATSGGACRDGKTGRA